MATIPKPIKKVHVEHVAEERTLGIYFGSAMIKDYVRTHCSAVEGYYRGTTFDTFIVSPVYDIDEMIAYIYALAEEVVEEDGE